MKRMNRFSGLSHFTATLFSGIIVVQALIILAAAYQPAAAQTLWNRQVSGAETTLGGIFLNDMLTATAVGYEGTILRTTDGGQTWVPQNSGSTERLWGVWFTDTNTGTVVGGNGTILHTTDGGQSWEPRDSGTTLFLYRVTFTDADNGFIVGSTGTLLRTTNGGETWNPVDLETTQGILDISFGDSDHGIATGQGRIYNTADGGTTWTNRTPEGTGGRLIYGVSFVDAATAMAVVGEGSDDGYVLKTTDGGENWTEVVRTGFFPRDVFLTSPDVATVVGNGGILKTTDGGETWEPEEYDGPFENLYGIFFHDANTGAAVSSAGSIFWTNGQATNIAWNGGPEAIPDRVYLEQNYPNPFNPSTVIRYGLPVATHVTVDVTTITGQKIAELIDEDQPAGSHAITWHAANMSGGIYLCRITAGKDVKTLKMTLLK